MRALLLSMALLTFVACRTLPPPPVTPWPERRAALQLLDAFAFSGQLAAATATEGFSAALRWQQQGVASTLSLRAPLGIGGAQLNYDGSALQVTASNGSHLEGAAAQAELVRMLGFELPLSSLRFWLLGVPDPAATATETMDAAQRLAQLQQGDWRVNYGEYTHAAGQWLPVRITVRRDALRLKLHISTWVLP